MLTSKKKKVDITTENNKLKEQLALLSDKDEKTQEEFTSYLKKLKDDEICKYMMGFSDIINLCKNHLFECKFKSQERFRYENSLKPECRREDVLKLKKLL